MFVFVAFVTYCLVVKGAREVCQENMYGPPEL